MTSTSLFNCEIANADFSQEFLDSLKAISKHPIIKVFPRKKGITAGEAKYCYWNSSVLSQTFGGDVIYGYGIKTYNHIESLKGSYALYGHGCWLTPEGNLVDVTEHDDEFIYFLPIDEKLILNGRTTEHLRELFFIASPQAVHFALSVRSNEGKKIFNYCGLHDHEIKEKYEYVVPEYVGNDVRYFHPFWINRLVIADAIHPDIVEYYRIKCGFKECTSSSFNQLFYPFLKEANSKNIKVKMGVTMNFKKYFKKLIKKSFQEDKTIFQVAYMNGIDLLHPMFSGIDSTWSSETIMGEFISGISTATGKNIKEYDVHKDVYDKHKVPTDKQLKQELKKRVGELNRQCWVGHISYKEFMILSNPYLYPHPSLVHKIGSMARVSAPLNRIGIA